MLNKNLCSTMIYLFKFKLNFTFSILQTIYSECLASRAEGLASRSQLAMLIFEHQQKLDQGHMNVIHQQNDPNVDQMKPNMLK